jgi:hypothetical protein
MRLSRRMKRLAQAAAVLFFPLSIVVAFAIVPFPLSCPSIDCGDYDSGEFLTSGFSVAQVTVVALGLLVSLTLAVLVRRHLRSAEPR